MVSFASEPASFMERGGLLDKNILPHLDSLHGDDHMVGLDRADDNGVKPFFLVPHLAEKPGFVGLSIYYPFP